MMEAGDSAEHAREMYDDSVTTVVIAASLVAVLASVGLAIVLARMLAQPLAEIGAAARRIADGDYAARVPREGPEELASLADSFNQMAASLERQEQMRRDFIANAAHELRTPLTNLQGYLEALRDGVIDGRPGDVRVAPRGGRPTRPAVALARCARRGRCRDAPAGAGRARPRGGHPDRRWSSRRRRSSGPGSRLQTDVPATPAGAGRPRRLAQVLANLLSNAVRYTPAGGSVTVRAERRPGDLLVSVANTGEGIPPEDLDRVFERFYRVEKSRDRARGGAGHRAGDREAARRGQRRPGRRGVRRRPTRFWFSLPRAERRARSPLRQPDRDHPDQDAGQPDPLDRLEPLPEEGHGDDDRHRRPERRRQADEPGLGDLEAVGERHAARRHRGRRRATTAATTRHADRAAVGVLALEQRRGRAAQDGHAPRPGRARR